MPEWYKIKNADQIDSPALAVYPTIIEQNIQLAIKIAGGTEKLRPHVKTNKMQEVCQMMIQAGINKFKCATIAEAEMLAMTGAKDVLLAYQPVGPKIVRLLRLIKAYPETCFSCFTDSIDNARLTNEICLKEGIILDVYIDLNTGMNRTGILPEKATALGKELLSLSNLRLAGIHDYDGHIHDADLQIRKQQADASYKLAKEVFDNLSDIYTYPLMIVIGGTPPFPIHVRRDNVECSPGTFVFWDWGYKHSFEDMPFEYAALVISRVISIVDDKNICIDLGYKSVASESPLPRVHFLNAPQAKPVAQSEEHLVLEVESSSNFTIGDILYGVPVHICPTVALYEKANVIIDNEKVNQWKVIARDRTINY